MSEEKHLFHVTSAWRGNSEGNGALTVPSGTVEYGVPENLGGKPGRTNPEEMLLAAVVSCYSITLAVIAERRRLPVTRVDVVAEGEMARQPDRTLKFTAIRLRPKITLENADEAQIKAALDVAHRAEQYCPISNAVRGNVEITLEPEIS